GQVQVYEYSTSLGWQQLGTGINGLGNNGDLMGQSVSLNNTGNVVAIGAPGVSSSHGAVMIYERDTTATSGWSKIGNYIYPYGTSGNSDAQSGFSVSL
mgnify:CR=1